MAENKEIFITNKELYQHLNDLRDRIDKTNRKQQDLRVELEQTRSLIRKYNNLTSKMDSVEGNLGELQKEVTKMKGEDNGALKLRKAFIEIAGWVTAAAMAIYTIFF